GAAGVAGMAPAPGTSEDELLALAAAVEADSEHSIARAISAAAERRKVPRRSATDFEALAGRGARAVVDGRAIAVGGPRLLAELGAAVPTEIAAETRGWAAEGRSVLHVVADGRGLGAVAVADEIRPESAEAGGALHRLGFGGGGSTGDPAGGGGAG